MGNPDSFINEVSEEVRRDRFYGLARRYGPFVALGVLLVLGVTGYFEWRQSVEERAARGTGDAILQAMASGDALGRGTALAEIEAEGDRAALRDMLAAAQFVTEDPQRAGDLLQRVINDQSVTALYRDLATLKLAALAEYPLLSDARLALLEPLTAPGAPFRVSALEQTALVHLMRDDVAAARAVLEDLEGDAGASPGQQSRARDLLTALGGESDAG